MNRLLNRFDNAIEGLAALNDYPYTERRGQWLDRLSMNVPELEALLRNDANAPDIGLLQPDAAPVCPGGSSVASHTHGVAGLADQHRRAPEQISHSVQNAWQAAGAADTLHAFIRLMPAQDLDRDIADAASAATQPAEQTPLLGVPIAVKDLMRVRGLPMSGGSGGAMPAPETIDADAIARLRRSGAVVIGTTNLHELAYGITSENPHHGWVVNPRHPGLTAGGSSGGSAAAVAAGIVPIAIGTDTAGSIRIPAACCGVVGFKPSFDAISRQGAMTLGASLDHIGPIAACVDDAALAFSIMAGLPPSVAAPPASLRGVRIGIPRQHFYSPLAPDVASAVQQALALLREDGAELVPVDIEGMERCAAIQFATLCSEATDQHWQRLSDRPDTLGEDVRVRLEIGQFLPAHWYVRAQRQRAALYQAIDGALHGVDLLATPTLRTPPPPSGQPWARIQDAELPLHTAMTSLTLPFNLTGMPAITLPCQATGNLPVGIQLAARQGQDWRVLDVAARLERLLQDALA